MKRYSADEAKALLAEARKDYESDRGVARWWQKDGAWHIALPGYSEIEHRTCLLWTSDAYDTREEAIAAINANQ